MAIDWNPQADSYSQVRDLRTKNLKWSERCTWPTLNDTWKLAKNIFLALPAKNLAKLAKNAHFRLYTIVSYEPYSPRLFFHNESRVEKKISLDIMLYNKMWTFPP